MAAPSTETVDPGSPNPARAGLPPGLWVDLLLLVLLLAALVWNLNEYTSVHPAPVGPDENAHVQRSFELALRLNPAAPGALPILPQDPTRPPLVYLTANLLYPILGFSAQTARQSTLAFLVLLLAATYGLGRLVWNRTTGLLAALLMASNPGVMRSALQFTPTLATVALTTAALFALLLARQSDSRKSLALASIVFAAAYLTKPTFLIFHAVMVLPCLWEAVRRSLERPVHRLAVLSVALLSPVPTVAWFLWREEHPSALLVALSVVLAAGAVWLGTRLSAREGRPGDFWRRARYFVVPSALGLMAASPYYLSHLYSLHRHLYRLSVEEVFLYPHLAGSTLPPPLQVVVNMVGRDESISLACAWLFLIGMVLLAVLPGHRKGNGFLVAFAVISVVLFSLFPVRDPKWPLPILPAVCVVAASVVGVQWGRFELGRRILGVALALYLVAYAGSWLLEERVREVWNFLVSRLGEGWVLPGGRLERW